MVKAIKGTFIETEPSIKEVILTIGEKNQFIIENINDTMVFINSKGVVGLKDNVSKIMSFNLN